LNIDENRIRAIVEEVVRSIASEREVPSPPRAAAGDGIFPDVDSAVDAAEAAQRELMGLSLEKRKEIIEAIRKTTKENAEEFARMTIEETGMGRYDHKVIKHHIAADLTPGVEDLETRAWSGDHGLTIQEMAPYGVIGSITPSTHPVPTVVSNAIGMIAAGNSVVFNAHPRGKNVTAHALRKINRAIASAGGPPNLLTMVEDPTIETAQAIFKHPKIALLVITGGPGVVKAAMSSEKKVIAAGPGNPPVVVDETADIDKAARDIIEGAIFDNNLLCISEKEVLVVEAVADELKRCFKNHGAYELTPSQIDQLTGLAFQEGRGGEPRLNRDLVGRDARVLAERIGLSVGDDVRILIGETEFEHPFVQHEQMMPFLPIVRVPDVRRAIDLAVQAEHGFGHTAIMHSKNVENMSIMARKVNTVIFVKNGPSSAGLGIGGEGYNTFSIATTTGEGITSPRTFTRMRRCVLVDYFRII